MNETYKHLAAVAYAKYKAYLRHARLNIEWAMTERLSGNEEDASYFHWCAEANRREAIAWLGRYSRALAKI